MAESAYRLRGKRVFVAGHRGMVGSAIVRRLAREEGIFCGTSGGATFAGALTGAEEAAAGATSATFDLTVVDDLLLDGPQTATVTAHVENWTDGSDSIYQAELVAAQRFIVQLDPAASRAAQLPL